MKKKKESGGIIEDLYNLLKILAKNVRGYTKREKDEENHVKRSEKKLSKIFGKEKLKNLVDLCFEQGYIRRERVKGILKKRGFEEDFYSIRIQGKGLKFLEEYEREEKKLEISKGMLLTTITLVIVTILALTITSFIAIKSLNTQIELANQNIEFLKQTSSTNWANIEFDFGNKTILVNAQRLANFSSKNQEIFSINFVAINSGKVNSGRISINPLSDENIYSRIEPVNDINISSSEGKEGTLRIIQKNCDYFGKELCNISSLPHLEYKLNLEIYCQFCSPEKRNFNQTIDLCIYHNQEEQKECNKLN